MQKWEYAIVWFGLGEYKPGRENPTSRIVVEINEKSVARHHYTNRKTGAGYYVGEPLHEYLNRAGQEGWKVVAVTKANLIVLERPVEE